MSCHCPSKTMTQHCQQISSATKTKALEKQISKKPNILQPLQGIHEHPNEKRICQKINWHHHRRKMLIYSSSRSIQQEQAQQNKSCFWLQHRISRKISKQWTYARSGFDQSNHWSIDQIQARTNCNNGWHQIDVLSGACTRKTSKFPKIPLVGK